MRNKDDEMIKENEILEIWKNKEEEERHNKKEEKHYKEKERVDNVWLGEINE